MVTVEEIEAMNIEKIKSDFFALMSGVVTTYGDEQEETSERKDEATNAE